MNSTIAALAATLLISIRIATALAFSPLFSAAPVPPMARAALVLAFSVAMACALPIAAAPTAPGAWVAGAVLEFALGLMLACGIACAFAAVALGGRILDIQVGFGIGQVFDPVSRAQVPILTSILLYTGMAVFLLMDGHHALLRGLALTFEAVPPGQFELRGQHAQAVIAAWGKMFAIGFILVAPVSALLWLVDIGLGVVARGMPQMNVFLIALPVKVMASLGALSLWIRHMPASLLQALGLSSDVWNAVGH